MKHLSFTLLLIVILSLDLSAQNVDKDVLLKINNTEIKTNEFLWLFNKNNINTKASDIDEYLDLYILSRLKIEQAENAGIDTSKAFIAELAGYRKQLASSYLTDKDFNEQLLQRTYKRSTEEVLVSHILIKCKANALPNDTLVAYNKALNVANRVNNGELFSAVAQELSDDINTKQIGGMIGYLSVFQAPMAFEDAIYKIKASKITYPVRSTEGYHIAKVHKRRPESGRIRAAHIMKTISNTYTSEQLDSVKAEIDSIYALLLLGKDFDELAKNNSDDKRTAPNGGELPFFGVGQMIHDFSELAFSLQNDGDISRPLKTAHGWHIIKRLEREKPLSFNEKKSELESKIQRSSLEKLKKKVFVDKLKKEYNYKTNSISLNWFYSIADSSFRAGTHNWEQKNIPIDVLFTYADKNTYSQQFADYITSNGKNTVLDNPKTFINRLYDKYVDESIFNYEASILENKYTDFGHLMREFHDGILLFEISSQKIWLKLNSDSVGLKDYWETRKHEFIKPESISTKIFKVSPTMEDRKVEKLFKGIKKQLKNKVAPQDIITQELKNGNKELELIEGSYQKGDMALLDNIKWKKGKQIVKTDAGNHFVIIDYHSKSWPMQYKDGVPLILNDYQDTLEKAWAKELKSSYPFSVNTEVFNSLKQKINNE